MLVEIARKNQRRGIATQFRKYRDRQAKTAAMQTDAFTIRKRTRAEALSAQIGAIQNKIGALDFLAFSTADREMVRQNS